LGIKRVYKKLFLLLIASYLYFVFNNPPQHGDHQTDTLYDAIKHAMHETPVNGELSDVILHHVINDKENVKFVDLSSYAIGGWWEDKSGNECLEGDVGCNRIGELDLSITKHIVILWVVAAIVILMALMGTERYRKDISAKPKGLSHIYELIFDFIKNDIVSPNIGENYSKKWMPLIATFFVFILTSNLFGLIPINDLLNGGSSTITGNFFNTIALAIITFFSIIIAGSQKHGFIGYWKNMIPHGVPGPVLIILIPIEILGMIIRPCVLTMRLGANMTAGHIGMIAIFALPMLLKTSSIGMVSVTLNTAIYFLEFIVCLVQAYVFTLLSAVFIGMAIHAEH
jgi:F-type H+-transporting ATPase subunit a